MKPQSPPFTVDDVNSAAWHPNCGPGALAGVLLLTLNQVRPHMGDFEQKHYTNPRLMLAALKSLDVPYRALPPNKGTWPARGLVRVQWCGPWTRPGVDLRARQRHTHWVAAERQPRKIGPPEIWIFDINCICVGGWVELSEWKDQVIPWLLREAEPKANGEWHPTHVLEIAAV